MHNKEGRKGTNTMNKEIEFLEDSLERLVCKTTKWDGVEEVDELLYEMLGVVRVLKGEPWTRVNKKIILEQGD